MRKIIPRKYNDESTTEAYRFVFYCECCGKAVSTYHSTTSACYTPKLFESVAKRRAQEALWLRDHRTAYEDASRETLQKLNRCESCGSLVCNDCSVIDDESGGKTYCTACAFEMHSGK